MKQSKSSQTLYKKMLGDFMLHCFFSIKTEDSEKIFETLQSKTFALETWSHLHNFDLERYKGDIDLDLSPEQVQLVEYVEEFDRQMKEKYGDQAPDSDDEDYYEKRRPVDIEPKIGGFSLKDLPSGFKILYLGVIVAAIGGGLLFAYKKLFSPELSAYEKKKIALKEKRKAKELSKSPTKEKTK